MTNDFQSFNYWINHLLLFSYLTNFYHIALYKFPQKEILAKNKHKKKKADEKNIATAILYNIQCFIQVKKHKINDSS